jgi:amino acid transporter
VAEATIEERQLLKSLNWYDGFVIGLCQPAFLLGSLGFTLATIGAWGSILLWGISATVGLLQNFIYAETAAMFPDKPGGIALYAHEGWRSRFNLFGPIGAFGYWIGWSVVLSFVGNIVGALIVAEWFPKSADGVDDSFFNLGFADFGLPQAIAIVVIIGVWLFNVLGVKPSLAVGYVTGALLMVPLVIFIVLPYFTGDWHSSNLEYVHNAGGFSDLRIALMWLFIMCWSAYGIEVGASFAPEYHDTQRDTAKALKSVAVFSLFVYLFLPLGLGGVVGSTGDYGGFYVGALKEISGDVIGGFAVICLIASLILAMNTSTADGGRALYGIARDDMTIKWLYHLNRFHVPARGMGVDMVVNIGLLLLLGANNFVILYISNIGYVFCHVLALTGFLLLRKDRPNWPRPIKVGPALVAGAGLLALFNFVLVLAGVLDQDVASYIGFYEFSGLPLYLGIGVLVASVLLFFYRRAVQDKAKITFRDKDVPSMPTAEQMALLHEETIPS